MKRMDSPLKTLSYYFILSLGLGTFLFQLLVNPKDTGKGFIRLVLGILIGCLVISLGFVISSYGLNSNPTYLLSIGLILSSFMYGVHPDERNTSSTILYLLISIILFAIYFIGFDLVPASYLVLSVLLLGVTNFTMILGHYYLVVPRLTERPLIVAHYLFWPVLIFKILLSSFFIYSHQDFFSLETNSGDGGMFNILLVSMRLLWGYGALGILSYFSYKLCKMRSTQSATGVLYIMVFFVLVGELISFYHFFKFGWFV